MYVKQGKVREDGACLLAGHKLSYKDMPRPFTFTIFRFTEITVHMPPSYTLPFQLAKETNSQIRIL